MIVMGVLMFTGKMNAMTGYLSTLPSPSITSEKETKEKPKETVEETPEQNESTSASDETSEEQKPLPAIDFTLKDQFGKTHSLSDYKGKTIFLNFWGTWCPPCRAEMPDIQSLYETQKTEGENGVIILGIAAPNYSGEKDEQGLKIFLKLTVIPIQV